MGTLTGKKVLVVGAGFGGLSAAAHLVSRGATVEVIEQAPFPGGKAAKHELDGFRFDTGPTLLTMPEVARELFSLLGEGARCPEFRRLDLGCRYLFANGKELTVYDDLERTRREIESVDREDADKFQGFLAATKEIWEAAGEPYLEAPFESYVTFGKRVLSRGLKATRLGVSLGSLDAFTRTQFSSEEMHMLVNRFATYAGGSPFRSSAAYAMIAHLELAEGAFYPVGGMHMLACALRDALKNQGVRFRFDARVENLAVSRSKLTGIHVSGEAESADAYVFNIDPCSPPLAGVLKLARPEPSLSGFVLSLGVKGDVPSGALHTILFPKNYEAEFRAIFDAKEIPSEPTVYVSVPTLMEPARAPEGHHTLFVLVNAPARTDAGYWEREGPKAEERILEILEKRWCSDLRSRIVKRQVRTPADLERTGAQFGAIYGGAPHGITAPFERPLQRTSVSGLYLVGGATHPGGGVPMVMLGGKHVASLVEVDLRRGRPPGWSQWLT